MRAALLVALILLPAPALAHVGGPAGPGDVWHHWMSSPPVLLALAASSIGYARGVRALRVHAGPGRHGIRPWRVGCFTAGIAAIAVALLSPLDAMAASLFSAHMVQHLLLMIVAPPLLVLGLPGFVFLWVLPRTARRGVGKWWERAPTAAPLRALWGAATAPVAAVVLHAAAVWAWHAPRLYEYALSSAPSHAVEHASFLVTGVLVSWAALRPRGASGARRAAGFATGILIVFATATQSGALGALLTFAGRPWYPAHGNGPALWGITALEDQQLAGLIMWVPGGLLYTAAAALLFGAWLSAAGQSAGRSRAGTAVAARAVGATAPASAPLVIVLALALAVGACRRSADGVTLVPGGDIKRGRQDVVAFGCGACHTIDGVRGARGTVGPPLTGIGARSMIAGQLPNTPDNLVRWLLNPPGVEPGTAMPALVRDSQTARDIAAYLYTLR